MKAADYIVLSIWLSFFFEGGGRVLLITPPHACTSLSFFSKKGLVHELGCFTNATEAECSFDTRLKLGKFVGCFEGGHVEEDHCPQDPKNCTSAAGLTEHFDAIQACYVSPRPSLHHCVLFLFIYDHKNM